MTRLLLTFLSLLLTGSALAQSSFIVASYNIRYQNPNDGLNVWENRREAVLGLIRFHEFDLIGLQEVVHAQLLDLARLEDFAWIGVGRDDGQQGGEYSPILYRKSRFNLIDSGTFWLSDTPDQVSFGWDAVCRRVCTWATFKDQKSGATFHLWNTHLDHKGTVAREKATELLLKRLQPYLAKKEAVILTGDFNFTPDAPSYKKLAQALPDSLTRSKTPPYGPTGTINSFDYHTSSSRRIDHIFLSRDIQVLKHGTLNDSYDFRFPSDHFPVATRIILPHPKS